MEHNLKKQLLAIIKKYTSEFINQSIDQNPNSGSTPIENYSEEAAAKKAELEKILELINSNIGKDELDLLNKKLFNFFQDTSNYLADLPISIQEEISNVIRQLILSNSPLNCINFSSGSKISSGVEILPSGLYHLSPCNSLIAHKTAEFSGEVATCYSFLYHSVDTKRLEYLADLLERPEIPDNIKKIQIFDWWKGNLNYISSELEKIKAPAIDKIETLRPILNKYSDVLNLNPNNTELAENTAKIANLIKNLDLELCGFNGISEQLITVLDIVSSI